MSKVACLLVLAALGSGLVGESVRSELIRQQAATGLTLVTVSGTIDSVDFATRSVLSKQVKVNNSRPGTGMISADGEEIAFDMLADHPLHRHLGVARADGTGLRQYEDVSPISESLCWSHDKSKMAMRAVHQPRVTATAVQTPQIVDLRLRSALEIDADGYFGSQCWSPDDSEVVYGVEYRIRIYDVKTGKSRDLTEGAFPAWSPDGEWIAFFDKDSFYATHPTGAGRKLLFKVKDVRGGPWWSPDSRMVAYLALADHWYQHTDFIAKQLRVRRLSDSSDDWVAEQADIFAGPEYQWVQRAQRVGR